MIEKIIKSIELKELDKLELFKLEILDLTDKEIKKTLLSISVEYEFYFEDGWHDGKESGETQANKDLLEFVRDARFNTYLEEMLEVVEKEVKSQSNLDEFIDKITN